MASKVDDMSTALLPCWYVTLHIHNTLTLGAGTVPSICSKLRIKFCTPADS